MTVKELRESIENKTIDCFKLQDALQFLAENIEDMPLGAEIAFKEYIRKGATYLNIDIKDLQGVYNSYRK